MADLSQLADQLIQLSDVDQTTPVLMVPRHMSLEAAFFCELSRALHTAGIGPNRLLRIDWLATARQTNPIRRLIQRYRVRRLNRQIPRIGAAQVVKIDLVCSIGRAGGIHRPLVMGYCELDARLPRWATPIRLAG